MSEHKRVGSERERNLDEGGGTAACKLLWWFMAGAAAGASGAREWS